MLVRCGSCDRLVRRHETACPFCGKNLRRRIVGKLAVKIAVGAIGGATAMMSGIGCAYGCPEPGCGPFDSGPEDSASDVVGKDGATDASLDAAKDATSDVSSDVSNDAENEAGEAGVSDASDAGAG